MVQKLPNRYVSHIPDVFTFSAWMVNLLLDLRQGEAAIVPTRLAVEEPAACLFRDEGAVYRVRFNGEAGTSTPALLGPSTSSSYSSIRRRITRPRICKPWA